MLDTSSLSQIFIYGTGTFALEIFDAITQYGISVKGFLDHLPRKPVLRGLEVTKPEIIAIEKRSNAVIIGIHNRKANITVIIDRLKSLGYYKIITPIDLYDRFAEKLGNCYWLTNRSFYQKFESQIQAANALWAGDVSREIYIKTIRFRVISDYSLLPEPDLEHQYFSPDLPSWDQPVRFVDCGAYNGNVIHSLSDHNYHISAVAAFEPDLKNFQLLTKYIQSANIQNAFLWPCGVYSSTTQLKFSMGQGESSVNSNTGKSVIQCVSLDDVIPDFKPILIKMDIEGAEVEDLRGAKNVVQKYRSGLAVSVYHSLEHIWEIPLLIKNVTPYL